jgi:nitroreductase
MDKILEVIKKRRSVRVYKDTPLPNETIDSILEAAKYAPTARNLQQLKYKVITNKILIRKMSDKIVEMIKKENPNMRMRDGDTIFHDAPLVIIITGPCENSWIMSDAALAVQNIMLYATSINLGSCFIGLSKYIENNKEILSELKIEENERIAAAVICGYANEEPEEKEKKINVEFIK